MTQEKYVLINVPNAGDTGNSYGIPTQYVKTITQWKETIAPLVDDDQLEFYGAYIVDEKDYSSLGYELNHLNYPIPLTKKNGKYNQVNTKSRLEYERRVNDSKKVAELDPEEASMATIMARLGALEQENSWLKEEVSKGDDRRLAEKEKAAQVRKQDIDNLSVASKAKKRVAESNKK